VTYRDSREEAVAFRALAIKHAGRKVTTLGRSGLVTVFWTEPAPPPPPTPPPPPPAATPGHYAGKTADNELWAFDIDAGGLTLTNLQTGQMNKHCDPPDDYLSRGELQFHGPIRVTSGGDFTIDASWNTTVDSEPATETAKITGHVANGTAAGTYRVETSFTYKGQGYSCTTGDQTWTAARSG
jgi:hypothetical protein